MKRTPPREYVGVPALPKLAAAEVQKLTDCTRAAALGVAGIFDVLRDIEHRCGRDWEPQPGAAVRDIVNELSVEITDPESAEEMISRRRVEQLFMCAKNWH